MLKVNKVFKSWQVQTEAGLSVSGNYHKTKKSALEEAHEFMGLLPLERWSMPNPFEGIDGALKDALIAVKRKYKGC